MADGRGGLWKGLAVAGILGVVVLTIFLLAPDSGTPGAGLAAPGGAPGGAGTSGGGTSSLSLCPPGSVEDITVTLNNFDEQNRGVATANQHSVWLKNNGGWDFLQRVTDGATFNAPAGGTVQVMFSSNASEALGTGVYSKLVEKTLTCAKGADAIVGFSKNKNETALTVSFFNDDDGLINSGADRQAIAANGEATPEMLIRGSSQDYFGDGKMLVVFDYNTTAYDSIKIIHPDAVLAPVPTLHRTASTNASTSVAWEIPELFGTANVRYVVTIDAAATEPTTGNEIPVTLYDRALFLNADTNEPTYGYQDEDNNDIGSLNSYQTGIIRTS